jgi:hypothetical protein
MFAAKNLTTLSPPREASAAAALASLGGGRDLEIVRIDRLQVFLPSRLILFEVLASRLGIHFGPAEEIDKFRRRGRRLALSHCLRGAGHQRATMR